MPLNLYRNVRESGSVPADWKPVRGGTFKDPVRNREALLELRRLLPGRWRKVIKLGNIGELHYFEHESGDVADVKFFAWTNTL